MWHPDDARSVARQQSGRVRFHVSVACSLGTRRSLDVAEWENTHSRAGFPFICRRERVFLPPRDRFASDIWALFHVSWPYFLVVRCSRILGACFLAELFVESVWNPAELLLRRTRAGRVRPVPPHVACALVLMVVGFDSPADPPPHLARY